MIVQTERKSIFGIAIDVLTRKQALDMLEQRMLRTEATKVAFANANLLNMAFTDATLRQCLQDFVVLNDGLGVNLASQMLFGNKFPDNLNGTDFVPYFLKHCTHPLKIYLLGATPEVVQDVIGVMAERWPRHTVVGYHHGFFDEQQFQAIKQQMQETQPQLVLVAMGNGLQETVAARLVPGINASVWCVGALFDFLTEQVPRAPRWMRAIGAEWVFRLSQEPGRLWRRYLLGNPAFLMRVCWQRIFDTPQ